MDSDGWFDVSGKVVVVSGGGRGIGLMIAEGFVSAGSTVYISSRAKDVLDSAAKALNEKYSSKKGSGTCFAIAADLSTVEGCRHLAEQIQKKESKVHVLVNNSGNNWAAPLDTFPESGFDKVMNLNLKGPFFLTQSLLPLLKSAGTKEDPARVINISSINGANITALETYSYSASKAGLVHLSRHLASKLADHNITVNVILPGAFATKLTKATLDTFGSAIVAGTPLKRLGKPSDISSACIFLASPGASWVTGATLAVDGGALIKATL
uniref:Uncharacterized protein n=1 Tax=Arcella intermedia TaxID=1963864 RepID=A0A6B2LEF9_9EUKA|eukprot:TRINITY_DN10837_c0_g1_i1.p1 TRINITY_DN10837_c0_g1~~TRINITY_DN10837_c0_g1_i1.p1  ORF type:complete len:268 (-),score=53.93 TRINITY_DN10837_c0_g1_i1:109-912(-)